jgi:hypothetical protein
MIVSDYWYGSLLIGPMILAAARQANNCRRRPDCQAGGRSPDRLAIERYSLKLARRENAPVCFLPTASGGDDAYIVRFCSTYAQLESKPTHLHLFRRMSDLRSLPLAQRLAGHCRGRSSHRECPSCTGTSGRSKTFLKRGLYVCTEA